MSGQPQAEGRRSASAARPQEALPAKLALSAFSAAGAETATFPIDLVKTRLQLQGELSSLPASSRKGALAMALHIARTEGLAALYAGLSPAVLRHVPYTGIRVVTFEQLRSLAQDKLGLAPGQAPPLAVSLAMGLTAGALGQAAAVPADLVKVRMQADGRLVASGLQAAPRYRGLLDAFAQIVRQEGVAGLWRGSTPAIQRAALVNLGELTTYDSAKRAVLASGVTGGDNVAAHTLSSLCSGFVASLVSTPADVVKTRIMNQGAGGQQLYRGVADCFLRTLRAEGWHGLYKGFLPTWARLGPWQMTFWLTYEQLRKCSGVGGF